MNSYTLLFDALIQYLLSLSLLAVGTNLVTCQKQPALGCVYKLVEVCGQARIKLSQDLEKTVIPGRKQVYRIVGGVTDYPLVDIVQLADEPPPREGVRVMCRHPIQEQKRAQITPREVIPLLHLVWDGAQGRVMFEDEPLCAEDKIRKIKAYIKEQLSCMRPDHLRYLNPTPFKVSVDTKLYEFMHNIWLEEAPVQDLE